MEEPLSTLLEDLISRAEFLDIFFRLVQLPITRLQLALALLELLARLLEART
jgi:hypothetical protein